MKLNTGLSLILAAVLLATSASGLAQKGPQQRPQVDRQRPANVDRSYDRERMQDRRPAAEKDRQQDKAKDQDQQKDRDIYGHQLMTEQERNDYRERLKNAETNQERQQIIAEHREKMQGRAKANGVDLQESEESE